MSSTPPKKSPLVFSKDIHDKYYLEYPEINNRREKFQERVMVSIKELSAPNYYRKRPIDSLCNNTELKQLCFDNCCDYLYLFENSLDNFEHFIYLFGELLEAREENKGIIADGINDHMIDLFKTFIRFNLGYEYNIHTSKIERTIDEVDNLIIKKNMNSIKENQNSDNYIAYQSCVDDFIKISPNNSSDDLYGSLGRMKKVLERTIGSKIKVHNGQPLRISNTNTILNKIFKDNNKEISTQENILSFIIERIHHDQEDSDNIPTPYKFNKSEFIYWWLEMNNLIYLINLQ
jgi:hypothetical protein